MFYPYVALLSKILMVFCVFLQEMIIWIWVQIVKNTHHFIVLLEAALRNEECVIFILTVHKEKMRA